MYVHIKLTESLETNLFGNNVSGRQWWSFGDRKRYLRNTDRSSKFWIECWMCGWPPLAMPVSHLSGIG